MISGLRRLFAGMLRLWAEILCYQSLRGAALCLMLSDQDGDISFDPSNSLRPHSSCLFHNHLAWHRLLFTGFSFKRLMSTSN